MKYILRGEITIPNLRKKPENFRFNSQSSLVCSLKDSKLSGVVIDSSLIARKNRFQGYPITRNTSILNINFYNIAYKPSGEFEGVKFGSVTQTKEDENTQHFQGYISNLLELKTLEQELRTANSMPFNMLERKLTRLLKSNPFQLKTGNIIGFTLEEIQK